MKSLFVILAICGLQLSYCQDQYLVKADSTWGKEIIKFPIDWAPKLSIQGYEELTFAPQWQNKNHENYWSLIMLWNIKTDKALPRYEIEYNLLHYFDYLMKPNHWAQEFPLPELNITDGSAQNSNAFNAQLSFFDGFYTGKVITTNITVSQKFYAETKKAIIVIKISPQPYSASIWKTLNALPIDYNLDSKD